MQEMQVESLDWEDLLEKEMATHSSTLSWKIPWMEEPGRLQSMGSQRVGCNWTELICHEVTEPDAMVLVFWMLSFKPAFSLSSFIFIKNSFVPLCFLWLRWCHLHIWCYWYFSWQSWFQLVLHPAWHFTWWHFTLQKQAEWQYTALMYSFPNFEQVHCSISGSKCCFLTCIEISQ